MAIEKVRKYRYRGTEYTMVKQYAWWPKIRVEKWETFETSYALNSYNWSMFELVEEKLWTPEIKENDYSNIILSKKSSKKVEEKRWELASGTSSSLNDLRQAYINKFWKKPFAWWNEEQLLSKLN